MAAVLRLSTGCDKWDIRQKVWDYMEQNNLADFPRPVHHRIPNFKSSRQAGQKISSLGVFREARELKVDPDKPLESVRLAALQAHKTLLVPTPRLRSGLFNRITPPPGAGKEELRICSTSQGVRDHSVPLGLDAAVRVDLVVVGSVAVSEKGWRIGKGEGFADMEYAMMVAMGAVTDQTVIVTVVHDCQVLEIPEELLDDHDVTVDYILTPTRVIETACARPRPKGIIWSKISLDMMDKIPILKKLREKERRLGKDVILKDERASALNSPPKAGGSPTSQRAGGQTRGARGQAKGAPADLRDGGTLYIGDIPAATRVSELKSLLRDRDASPLHLAWQGAQRRAFLTYGDPAQAEAVLAKLEDLSIGGHGVRVEWARARRGRTSDSGVGGYREPRS